MTAYAPETFIKTLTTAGTAEALSALNSLVVQDCTIQALPGSDVAIGGSNVEYDVDATAIGILLTPGDSIHFDRVDLSKVYLDASNDDEGVSVLYFPPKGR